jgi:hypothetical protein
MEYGGDVYLDSSRTHADHEAYLVDSGASFHLIPHKEWFCEYERYDGGDVFLGDDSINKLTRRGNIKLKIMDGRIRKLPSVLHIPRLAINLIYVRKMDDVRVKIMFEKETYRMLREEMVLMKAVWFRTMHKLQRNTISDGCNSSIVHEIGAEEVKTPITSKENTMSWHQRHGHSREKGFQVLHGKVMVEGMSNFSLDFDFCEHCIYGKQNRVRFPFEEIRVEGILELVHSDVFGPVLVPSLGKSMYYVSFIYGFSRNTWNHFLRKKSKVFDRFK